MSRIELLGTSPMASCITFDMLYDVYGQNQFRLYPNIADNLEPLTPVMAYNYEIMEPGQIPDVNDSVFFGTTGPKNKRLIFESFFKQHEISKDRYVNVVHPSVYLASSSLLGGGCLMEPMSIISSQSRLGFGVFLKRGSSIGHHNRIGDFVDINPGVTISGDVTIGNSCTIGSGSVIRDHVTIGENTIIGMGSVVTSDIPANTVAFGAPCKVVRPNPS